jgi:hypothetical protein
MDDRIKKNSKLIFEASMVRKSQNKFDVFHY